MIDVEKLLRIEYHGERVLTTRQVAEAYKCPAQTILHNFRNNQDKFAKGVHYFRLEGAELREFKAYVGEIWANFSECKNITPADVPFTRLASSLYLWTHQGCVRHCKLVGTDKAWEMFNTLEKTYFAALEQPPLISPPALTDGKKLLIEIIEAIDDVQLQRLFVREIVSMLIK